MKKNVMKRAWEIYRTLIGDHIAKLAMALREAWAETKNTAKTMREQCIDRMNTIIANSATYNYCEMYAVAKDWIKGNKNRTYIKIVEAAKPGTTKHYKEIEYGYIDNVTNEYVADRRNNVFDNFTFSGAKF